MVWLWMTAVTPVLFSSNLAVQVGSTFLTREFLFQVLSKADVVEVIFHRDIGCFIIHCSMGVTRKVGAGKLCPAHGLRLFLAALGSPSA